MPDVTRREFGQAMTFGAALVQAQRDSGALLSGSLTDVPGIRVGHFTDTRRPTGCTAILFDSAVAAGVDYNGSAPGEAQVVLLQPVSPVERIHARSAILGSGPMHRLRMPHAVRRRPLRLPKETSALAPVRP